MLIQREKYTIRQLEITDAPFMAKNANNINIWNNVRDYFPYPYSEQDALDFIRFTRNKKEIEDFVIIVDRQAVGMVGYVPGRDIERLNAEIGYWIGEDYWSKGIMSAVLKDVINYIFENTQFIRLFAPVFEYNHASMWVLQKNGFNKIAILKNAGIKNNKIIDLHYHELLKQ